MKLTPDNFRPVMPQELRELWRAYPDPRVRRLILEVHRAREVQDLTHADATRGLYAGPGQNPGEMKVRLDAIAGRIAREHIRLGSHGGIPVDVGRPAGSGRGPLVPGANTHLFDPKYDDDAPE